MGALSLYALPLSAVCLTIPCAFTHKSVNPLRAQPLRAHPLLISVIPSLPTPMLATTQARRGALVHETLVRSPLRPSAYARALSFTALPFIGARRCDNTRSAGPRMQIRA